MKKFTFILSLLLVSIGLMAANPVNLRGENVRHQFNGEVKTQTTIHSMHKVAADVINVSVDCNALTFADFGLGASPAGTNDAATFDFTNANGDAVGLQLINDLSADYLPAGTYTFQAGDADLTAVPGFVSDGYLYGAYIIMQGTTTNYYLLTGGTCTVSYSDADHKNISILFNATGEDAQDATQTITYTSTCSGVIPDHPEFMLEPTETTDFTACSGFDVLAYEADNAADQDTLVCSFTDTDMLVYYPVIVAAGTTTLSAGTYTIADPATIGSSFASVGVEDGYITVPFGKNTADGTVWYFIVSGSLTVATDATDPAIVNYSLNATSYNGSTFIYSYDYNNADAPFLDETVPASDFVFTQDSSMASFSVMGMNAADVDTVTLAINTFDVSGLSMTLAFAVPAGTTVVPAGVYPVNMTGDATTVLASTMKGDYSGFVPSGAEIAEGWSSYYYSVTDGTVTVADNAGVKTYTVAVSSHFGSTFTGVVMLDDADAPFIAGEPATPTTIDLGDVLGASVVNKGDSLGLGVDVYEVMFQDADGLCQATLELFSTTGSSELAAGTYALGSTNAAGTAMASQGATSIGCHVDSMMSFWGYTFLMYNYYLVSGDVVVADDPANVGAKLISGTLTSHFGTTFTFNASTAADTEKPFAGYETETMTDYTGVLTTLSMYKDADSSDPSYPGLNVISYQFENADLTLALSVVAPTGVDMIADGTYMFSDTQAEGTVILSDGLNDDQTAITGSFGIVDAVTPPYYFLVSGSMVVATSGEVTTYTIDATSHYGSTFNYTYTINTTDYNYSSEPNVAGSYEYYGVAASAAAVAEANDGANNAYKVLLQSGNDFAAYLMAYTTGTSLADGVYTIGETAGNNVLLASSGQVDGSLTPSFCASLTLINSSLYYDDMFFLASGTLTVSKGATMFYLDATSFYGSHIIMSTNGVGTTNPEATQLDVYTNNDAIIVNNATSSEVVVFNTLGQVVARAQVENGQVTINGLTKDSVYMVKSGESIVKVQL